MQFIFPKRAKRIVDLLVKNLRSVRQRANDLADELQTTRQSLSYSIASTGARDSEIRFLYEKLKRSMASHFDMPLPKQDMRLRLYDGYPQAPDLCAFSILFRQAEIRVAVTPEWIERIKELGPQIIAEEMGQRYGRFITEELTRIIPTFLQEESCKLNK